jgi:WD40 repeat protein
MATARGEPAPADGVVVTLEGHTEIVSTVAFSPDGQYVMTGSFDKTLRVWETRTGKEIKVFGGASGHQDLVLSVAFSRDGRILASGSSDKTAKLWDMPLSSPLREFTQPDAVTTFAVSPDGAKLATAAKNGTVRVWNTADAKELFSLTGHAGSVKGVAFSANGQLLATCGSDKTVRFWNAVNGQAMAVLGAHPAAVNAVLFGPNNNTAYSAGEDGTLEFWQWPSPAPPMNTLSIKRTIVAASAAIRGLAVIPTGSHILTGSSDKTLKLWNTVNGIMERSFGGAEGEVTAVAVSRNGILVAAGGTDKSVRLYTLADAKQQGVLQTASAIRSLAFSPDNQKLVAACDDGSLPTWNVVYSPGQPISADFGKPGLAFAHGAGLTKAAFGVDSTTLYAIGRDKTIVVWKLSSDVPIKNLAHANLVDAVAFNASGTLLATGSHDGTLRIWDVAKGQQVRQITAHKVPMMSQIYCLAWSPDGKQLVSGSLDHSLNLWDAAAGTLVREFKAYKEGAALPLLGASTVGLLCSTPGHGPSLAAARAFPGSAEENSATGHREAVFCAAFSPDGKLLASGGSDRTIKIWNVVNARVLHELVNPNLDVATNAAQAHPGWVYSLQFTPSGTRLVSVGNAPRNHGYLAVWNVADGKLLYGEELPLGPFYSVAISPDEKLLALACGPSSRQEQKVNGYIVKMPTASFSRRSQNAGPPGRVHSLPE